MRIISPRPVKDFIGTHPNAEASMSKWLKEVAKADWKSIADVRRDHPKADAVPMKRGRTATIFNVAGNNFRIACSIRYDIGRVYVRRVMTHAEYDTNAWHNDF